MRFSRITRTAAAFALALGGFTFASISADVPAAQADECYTWSRTLNSGATGSDVSELQIRVAGWVPRGQVMGVDGSYGPQTKTAVTNFQRAYGLVADGIAGPATFSKIYALQDADCSPAHFTWAEVSQNCGRGLNGDGSVPLATVRANLKRAMWQAEALRHQLGDHPLRVTSGFRDKACDGYPYGQHTYGKAIDLVPGDGGTTICSIAKQARYAGFGGIFGPGYPDHHDHAHVDTRSTITWDADACSGW